MKKVSLWMFAVVLGYASVQAADEPRNPSSRSRDQSPPRIDSVPRPPRVPDAPAPPARPRVVWVGVGTEEVSEALAAQLGLKNGEGLVVNFVAPDSPAAKGGILKNDVLVQLDDQFLVHPAQLRKLVQVRKPGDSVKLAYIRAGKKSEATLELQMGPAPMGFFDEGEWRGFQRDFGNELRNSLREQGEQLRRSLQGMDGQGERLREEIRRSLEQARRAVDQALRGASNSMHEFSGPAQRVLRDLARRDIHVNPDSSVTVRRDQHNVRTMVKTDDLGTIILVADPRLRVTVRDKDGDQLFDGEVETEEQLAQMPEDLQKRVRPVIDQFKAQPNQPPKPMQPPLPQEGERPSGPRDIPRGHMAGWNGSIVTL